jgi:hypothetical protein
MNHTGVASTGRRQQARKKRASCITGVELVNIQPIYYDNVALVIASPESGEAIPNLPLLGLLRLPAS